MKIPFKKTFKYSAEELIRKCGYGKIFDRYANKVSYVKRLGQGHYPRFHLYVNSQEPLILNLHLDQKKASYQGQKAHSGDYDSDLVRQEALRIYNQIMDLANEQTGEEEPKGFFYRIFGKK